MTQPELARYRFAIREVHVYHVEVEAGSLEEALDLANDEYHGRPYADDLESSEWTVDRELDTGAWVPIAVLAAPFVAVDESEEEVDDAVV